jgi:hypothetical protein
VRALSFALSIFLVLTNSGCARRTPTQVVTQLYRDYSWEVDSRSRAKDAISLIDQPASELARYFDSELVSLLIADRECVRRSGEICRLDWDPIWDSQDPAAEDLTIRSIQTNVVVVRFRHPFTGEERKLDYHLVKTMAGWRISDIRYQNGTSLLRTLRPNGRSGDNGLTTEWHARFASLDDGGRRMVRHSVAVCCRPFDDSVLSVRGRRAPFSKHCVELGYRCA